MKYSSKIIDFTNNLAPSKTKKLLIGLKHIYQKILGIILNQTANL